jgi:hypothetical protein
MEIIMDNVYILQKIDHTDHIIMGVFPAESLAEMAREELEAKKTDDQYDQGIFYRITAFQVGKLYS